MILKLTVTVEVAQSCLTLCDPHGLYSPWNSPGQNTGLDSFSPLQGIFPTQGSNPSLLYCMQILYQLSHKGSPRILEWVAYSFLEGIRHELSKITVVVGDLRKKDTCSFLFLVV